MWPTSTPPRDQGIGDKLPVTLPPDGFRAHDHGRRRVGNADQLIKRVAKRVGLHIVRIPAEAFDPPGRVRRIRRGLRRPPSAGTCR